ncbi:DNA repair protein RadA [Spirochaetes bacterium]|uniref:DNA repair protein RadA n=1 Tax=Candidatus Scatousia excrementipullorum TaxID=2840936 RepID=A0A9D9DP42_9BACT|nr:DNA repair protein RadA [Candidatus Scatousia excrementipullorum]
MAKVKSKWVCSECGYETAGYLGKCPECGSWGSLVEEVQYSEKLPNAAANEFINTEKPALLKDIKVGEGVRVSTNISEFDRILGGGFVQGSLVLLAGDPGIGKSTITLQTCGELCKSGKKVLYVSAEESASQLKLRADRLEINSDSLYIYPQTNMENIKIQIEELAPDFVVVDSIQAIYSNNVPSSAGSVSQIRECCNILMHIAKSKNITTIVIGHVTKDGSIAGPKVLEHMVDTVIYFEGDKYKSYRMLRSMKNRFGNTSEVGIFEMNAKGLRCVSNPNELFLNERSQVAAPGSAIVVTNEGTRPLMVEIQALVGTTSYPSPRRVTNGVDISRLHQILAVLEKRVGLNLSKQDVYVNVMGGIEVDEPSADLGIALAVATCARDVVVDSQTVIIGEIGLSGEIHPVNNIEKRLNEAAAAGFKKAIIPYANDVPDDLKKIETVKVKRLMDAIAACVSAQ